MPDSINELLRYHIEESRKRHDELKKDLKEDLSRLLEKVDAFSEFKIKTLVNARWVALIISSVCGLVTMIGSAFLTAYLKTGGH